MSRSPSDQRTTDFVPGPAAETLVSLSQAILAPLDALAKGQVHAARSFLNFLLQIGYPHRPLTADKDEIGTEPSATTDDLAYQMTFRLEQPGSTPQEQQVVEFAIPALALVPMQPLGIESADYSIELVIREIDHHRQIQISEDANLQHEHPAAGVKPDPTRKHEPRPWYLVSDPVSIRGTLSDPGDNSRKDRQASIKVNVKVARVPTPEGLAKLLTAMTQNVTVTATPPQP